MSCSELILFEHDRCKKGWALLPKNQRQILFWPPSTPLHPSGEIHTLVATRSEICNCYLEFLEKSQSYVKAGSLTTPAHVGSGEMLQQLPPSHLCIAGKCLRCWSAHFAVGSVGKVQTPPASTAPALSLRTLTRNHSRSFASELPMACR